MGRRRPGRRARRARHRTAARCRAPGLPAATQTSKAGAGLGKTSGWVHRASAKARGVETIVGVTYERIDDAGLHITVRGRARVLEVDDVVVCAGQESRRDLLEELQAGSTPVHVIGGADAAAELDAKRAIDQGTRLAASL